MDISPPPVRLTTSLPRRDMSGKLSNGSGACNVPFPGHAHTHVLRLRFGERLGLGEVFQIVEAEQFKESLGGPVENRAPRFLGAAGNFYEVLLHETADRLTAGDAADGLDVD